MSQNKVFRELMDAEEDEFELKPKQAFSPTEEQLRSVARSLEAFQEDRDKLRNLIFSLSQLVPNDSEPSQAYCMEDVQREFVGGLLFNNQDSLSPGNIALLSVHEFLQAGQNTGRFTFHDPRKQTNYHKLPKMERPADGSGKPWINISIGEGKTITVPVSQSLWVEDHQQGIKLILEYSLSELGMVSVKVLVSRDVNESSPAFIKELKDAVMTSQYVRGRILEMGAGGFRVMELDPNETPVLSTELTEELYKNIINLFSQREEFERHNLPIKRAIVLEGPPGTGKTLVGRWLCRHLVGKVTCLWVTAKSISSPEDVQRVFEFARKMTPAMIIMEDLDLISGSRRGLSSSICLGEMLSQLDGVSPNESIVLVASTNKVRSLDEALNDRPGRFDRIYEVGHPSSEIAAQIARNYLMKHGIDKETVEQLDLSPLMTGALSGAQVVEIAKGGIFEAIHRKAKMSNMHLRTSAKGLQDQRKRLGKE